MENACFLTKQSKVKAAMDTEVISDTLITLVF